MELVPAIFGGIIGSIIGESASLFAYSHGYLNIERSERRKSKIALLDDLMASRYALMDGHQPNDAERRDFNRAMARIPHVFAEHRNVIEAYDKFCSMHGTDNLISLFQEITVACGLRKYAVAPSHIVQVRTL